MTKFEPMRPKGFQPPSGRPLRRSNRGVISRPRHIPDEPFTPGLRKGDEKTEAIGFMTDFPIDDDDEEEFDYTRESE